MSRGQSPTKQLTALLDRVERINDTLALVLTAEPEEPLQRENAIQVIKDNLSDVVVDYIDWQDERDKGRKGGTP